MNEDDLGDEGEHEGVPIRSDEAQEIIILRTKPDVGQRIHKVLIAAEYGNVKLNIAELSTAGESCLDLVSEPLERFYLLETQQGLISESYAMAHYISRVGGCASQLCGSTSVEFGLVQSWLDFCAHELEPPAVIWSYSSLGLVSRNERAEAHAKGHFLSALGVLERHMIDRDVIVGKSITLADISIGSTILYPFKLLSSEEYAVNLPNIARWLERCVGMPQFASVLCAYGQSL